MAVIRRTENAVRNIIFGIVYRIYSLLLPFFMRSVIVYFLGVEYLGLDSLFVSILQVLNLAELGVGSAMVYAMYEPVSKDDNTKLCALLRLYKIYYRIIGVVIAALGLVCLPFIGYLVKGDVPADVNIYVLYLFNLSVSVATYWLFAYRISIFQAHQREDVISKVSIFTLTFKYGVQFIVLWITKNYYFYVVVALGTQIIHNLICAFVSYKMYPNFIPQGLLQKKEIKKINKSIRDLFTAKFAVVITGPTDTVVVSAFLGITILAMYQNYLLIVTSVILCVNIIFQACTAGIGNSLITESKKKNYNDLSKLTFIIIFVASFCTSCLLNLLQPFMHWWMGQDLMFDFSVVICFCLYFFFTVYNTILYTYKEAAGLWHIDRLRPLCTALVNLILNLITVNFLGVYGVILSTVAAYIFVGTPWLLHNLFSTIFDKAMFWDYVKKTLLYSIVALLIIVVSFLCCSLVNVNNSWLFIIIALFLCGFISIAIEVAIFYRTRIFKEVYGLIKRVIFKK